MNSTVQRDLVPGAFVRSRNDKQARLWNGDYTNSLPAAGTKPLADGLPPKSLMLIVQYSEGSEYVLVIVNGLLGYVSIAMVSDAYGSF